MGADVVNRENVGMIQRGGGACFQFETMEPVPVGSNPRGDDLDRDVAAKPWIARAVHLAHTAGPDRRHDVIRPELLAGA